MEGGRGQGANRRVVGLVIGIVGGGSLPSGGWWAIVHGGGIVFNY